MSLILSTGFDTAPSNADLRSQGWMGNAPVPPNAGRAFASPINHTGIPGRSLRLAAYSGSAALPGTAQVGDPGFFNTGRTINQLWQAGGFVVGARMKFNATSGTGPVSENDGQTGGMTTVGTSSPRQVAVDGQAVYAIRNLSDSVRMLALQKSMDGGITWTTLTPPAQMGALDIDTTLNIVEPGTLMVCKGSYTIAGPCYTRDDGQTWTQITSMGNLTYGECIATGNPSFPYAFSTGAGNINSGAGIWLSSGTLNGPWTRAVTTATTQAAYPCGPLKFLPGLDSKLYCAFSNGWIAAVDLATGSGGTMTRQAGLTNLSLYSMDYMNGAILLGTNAGVYRAAAFDGTWTQINSNPTYASVVDGDTLVLVGNDSTVYTTTDGQSLTGALYNGGPNLSGAVFHGIAKWGQKFVAWMLNGSFWHCESPKARTQGGWQCIRWPDRAEQATRTQSGFGIVGAVAGSLNQAAGTFSVASSPSGASTCGLWITSGAVASNQREIQIMKPGSAFLSTVRLPVSRPADAVQRSNYHYYEVIAITDPNVVNAFFYAVRIDGGYYVPRSESSVALAQPADTTSLAFVNLPRTGQWTQFDDLYMTDYGGAQNRGVIGPLNIMQRTMASDVMSEWTRVGNAASDAATVTKAGISGPLTNYMESSQPGAREAFTTEAGPAPDLSAYSVRALKVEAYVRKANAADPDLVMAVGEVASPVLQVPVTTGPVFVSHTYPVDPGGNAWQVANVPSLVVSIRNSEEG